MINVNCSIPYLPFLNGGNSRIRADDRELLMDFDELGLIDLVVNNDEDLDSLPEDLRDNEEVI